MRCKLFYIILFLTPLMHLSSSAQHSTAISIDWEIAAELPPSEGQQIALGLAGPVVGVRDHKLIVGGGANFPDSMPWLGGTKKYYNNVYVFKKDPKGNVRVQSQKFHLPESIAYAACVSIPEGILVAGGENQTGLSNKVLLLNWNQTGQNISIRQLPNLPMPLTNASVASDSSTVFLAGGETAEGVSDKFFSLNVNDTTTGWQEIPSLPKPVSHAIMVIQSNGKSKGIYIIGGRKRNSNGISDLYASVLFYDLNKKKWIEKQSLPYTLSAGTGLAFGNHSILIFGGDKGETFHKTEVLIAAINQEKNEAKKQQLMDEKAKLQASHPGFSDLVMEYNTCKNEWKTEGKIPFAVPATTTAVWWDGVIIIPSGEIRAGVRSPDIIAGKVKDDR